MNVSESDVDELESVESDVDEDVVDSSDEVVSADEVVEGAGEGDLDLLVGVVFVVVVFFVAVGLGFHVVE